MFFILLFPYTGGKVYTTLRETYRFFGPIYYFVFCFTAMFIIMNILIAIIGESHKHTNSDLEKMNNQYEIIDFMMKRFMKWSGMDRYVGKNKSELLFISVTPIPSFGSLALINHLKNWKISIVNGRYFSS